MPLKVRGDIMDLWQKLKNDYLNDSDTEELVFVECTGGSDCIVSMHVKENGSWQQLFRCPGFIGREGPGKTRDGDWKTPIGIFRLKTPFGTFRDIGSRMPYIHVNEYLYWCDDIEHYNKMVDIRDCPNGCTGEHLIDYIHYKYSMLIDYNSECIPGLGNAIFLHCFGGSPYSAGCVAIDLQNMKTVIRRAGEHARIAIYTTSEVNENA